MPLRLSAEPIVIGAIALTGINIGLPPVAISSIHTSQQAAQRKMISQQHRSTNAALLSPPSQLAIRTARPTNHGRKLRVHNICSQPIELALRYQAPQQTWQTRGWWTIPGKSSRYFSNDVETIQLFSKVMFYYARALQSELIWSGNGSHTYPFEQQTLDMRIHYATVDVLDDYSLFILCNDPE